MNHFDNPNFDIAEYINFPGLEKLNRIALYLDYGISTTIKKQMPNITV